MIRDYHCTNYILFKFHFLQCRWFLPFFFVKTYCGVSVFFFKLWVLLGRLLEVFVPFLSAWCQLVEVFGFFFKQQLPENFRNQELQAYL